MSGGQRRKGHHGWRIHAFLDRQSNRAALDWIAYLSWIMLLGIVLYGWAAD